MLNASMKPISRPDGARVVVLDDDNVQLSLMRAMLEGFGLQHGLYTDTADLALARLEQDVVDLIFLDHNRANVDGLEFIKSLGTLLYKGSLIIVSGHDQRIIESSRDLAVSYGLNVLDTVQKPVTKETVSCILERMHYAPAAAAPKHAEKPVPVTIGCLQAELEGKTDFLELVYQPKFNMRNGNIEGYEVLSRWKRGETLLPPGLFIPLARESGLLDELSMQVYSKALQTHKTLSATGRELSMAINFSIPTLTKPGVVESIVRQADECGIKRSLITIEITEDQIYGSIQDYLEKLMYLVFNGLRLSIDDFGTGQSSLVHVKSIPFAELKVDRQFVHGAFKDKRSSVLFESSVRLARQLGMQVVAEGGETVEDWDFARDLGCHYFQGFYKAKPMKLPELVEFMNAETSQADSAACAGSSPALTATTT